MRRETYANIRQRYEAEKSREETSPAWYAHTDKRDHFTKFSRKKSYHQDETIFHTTQILFLTKSASRRLFGIFTLTKPGMDCWTNAGFDLKLFIDGCDGASLSCAF